MSFAIVRLYHASPPPKLTNEPSVSLTVVGPITGKTKYSINLRNTYFINTKDNIIRFLPMEESLRLLILVVAYTNIMV